MSMLVLILAVFAVAAVVIAAVLVAFLRGAASDRRNAPAMAALMARPPRHPGPVARWYVRLVTGPGAGVSGVLEVSGGELAMIVDGEPEPRWAVPVRDVRQAWPPVRVSFGSSSEIRKDTDPARRVRLYLLLPSHDEVGIVVSHQPLGATWTNLTELDENRALAELQQALAVHGVPAPGRKETVIY